MLTSREYDQIQIALFAMGKARLDGQVVVDYAHTLALLKSYTEGELEVVRDGDAGLNISFTPKEEKK